MNVVVVVVVEIVAVVMSEEETVESEWEKRKTSDFDRQSTTDNRASRGKQGLLHTMLCCWKALRVQPGL